MQNNQNGFGRSLCMRGFCRALSGLVLIVIFHLSTSVVGSPTVSLTCARVEPKAFRVRFLLAIRC